MNKSEGETPSDGEKPKKRPRKRIAKPASKPTPRPALWLREYADGFVFEGLQQGWYFCDDKLALRLLKASMDLRLYPYDIILMRKAVVQDVIGWEIAIGERI